MRLYPIARRLTGGPMTEPLDLNTQVKPHLRVQHNLDDTLIQIYIAAARSVAEKLTGKKFLTQTWEFDFPCFPFNVGVYAGSGYEDYTNAGYGYQSHGNSIQIPVGPVQAVNFVNYLDPLGNPQTFGTPIGSPVVMEEWSLIRDLKVPRVALNVNQVWPPTAFVDNAVTISVLAGFGDTAAGLPPFWIAGMLMLVGHFYENRESVVTDESRVQSTEVPLGIRDLFTTPKAG